MTIASEITRINGNITAAYTACNNKGATMPVTQNSANLATCIGSISGGGSSPVISSLTVTPITSQQTITAPSGTDGYSPITVNAVTSSIDSNIVAGNIKKDVQILGVTGTYAGASKILANYVITSPDGTNYDIEKITSVYDSTITLSPKATTVTTNDFNQAYANSSVVREISLSAIENIEINEAFNSFTQGCLTLIKVDLSNLTSILADKVFNYAFNLCTGLTSIDLSSLTTVSGSRGLYYAFRGCTGLTSIDLSSLTTVSGSEGLSFAFQGCTGLTSIDLSSLTTMSGSDAFRSAFRDCTGLTSIDLSSLTTVSGSNALNHAFSGCTGLTSIDLSSLTTVSGSQGLYYAFRNCTGLTDIYFKALTTSSFGSYKNQFYYMMNGTGSTVTHTIHFPSNMQSTISGLTGYPLFGGSSGKVVLSFDLPATS